MNEYSLKNKKYVQETLSSLTYKGVYSTAESLITVSWTSEAGLKKSRRRTFCTDDAKKLAPTLHVNIRYFGEVLLQKIDTRNMATTSIMTSRRREKRPLDGRRKRLQGSTRTDLVIFSNKKLWQSLSEFILGQSALKSTIYSYTV